MKVVITSKLEMPAIEAWKRVKQSRTLVYVCKAILSFDNSELFPEAWQENQLIDTRLIFFGLIPGWKHSLHFVRLSDEAMILFTHEHGGLVQKWNHEISIRHASATSCIYRDTVDIEAGLMTPLVWLFAQVLYRYRQRRWRHFTGSSQNKTSPPIG